MGRKLEAVHIIQDLDYTVVQRRKIDYKKTVSSIGTFAIIICLYYLLQRFGVLNLLVPSMLADQAMSYGMLFVVGLLTSVHCIAMCGGINLSQCIPSGKDDRCIEFYKSGLCAQTRASSLAGGMPVW